MAELPIDVRDYLGSADVLYRAELVQRAPDVLDRLADPQTAADVREWLASDEAQHAESADLVVGALNFLTRQSSDGDEADAALAARFRAHPAPLVRLRAFEYEASRQFRAGDQEALVDTLTQMLEDDHETVRTQSARLIQRADVADQMRSTLTDWHERAQRRPTVTEESRELVRDLLQRE